MVKADCLLLVNSNCVCQLWQPLEKCSKHPVDVLDSTVASLWPCSASGTEFPLAALSQSTSLFCEMALLLLPVIQTFLIQVLKSEVYLTTDNIWSENEKLT